MNLCVVRRSTVIAAAFGAVLVAACGEDKRVKQLHSGMARDSVLTVIGQDVKPDARPDSLFNVYKRDRYLIAGKNYEILYFTPNNEKMGKDTVPLKNLTPIVFADNKLIGRGWSFWDSVSQANKIPVQKR